ncbi:RNA 2',3'-cyclic phosphodiesterase [Phenylobacterium sp.]|uniref:RNA 2',3'-cyclic phosphodiesterase n=1 Tax=Phenylobacterium sp. TaxID=1871053 RepID=UPI0030F48847
MIRLFAAVAVPPELGAVLQARQSGLAGANWRPLEAFHVTLRFFGEVREDVADDLHLELERIAAGPMTLELEGVGAFGEGPDLHAVWAGVKENDSLRRLAKACETAARRSGLKAEARAYRPHVTLAYLKRPDPGEVAAWLSANGLLKSPPFDVKSFGLYSSLLLSGGSRYQPEQIYRLR